MSILTIDSEPIPLEHTNPIEGTKNLELQYELLCPFGPRLGHFFLDSDSFLEIKKLADKILKNKKRTQYGHNLAGMIEDEPELPVSETENPWLYNMFTEYTIHYIKTYIGQMGYQTNDILCKINEAWLVNQKAGEYNPAHTHGNCNVSAVMYLQVPEYNYNDKLSDKKSKNDGKIDFINNSSRELWELEMGAFSVDPAPGHLFIFPSRLTHTVYPFQIKPAKERKKGDPITRLSLSYNAQVWIGKQAKMAPSGFEVDENDKFDVTEKGKVKRKPPPVENFTPKKIK